MTCSACYGKWSRHFLPLVFNRPNGNDEFDANKNIILQNIKGIDCLHDLSCNYLVWRGFRAR